jgi:uncharacterized membrane protein YhaH (DUF805 family)
MRRRLHDNSLGLFFLLIFLLALVGQAIAGHDDFNHTQLAHHDDPISFWTYVTSSVFWVDVAENWQSEYLQFVLFLIVTVWFVQRGSTESKKPDEAGTESDEEQKVGEHAEDDSPLWARTGGWRTKAYGNSLLFVMLTIFVLSWLAQAVTGRIAYNADQIDHGLAPLGFLQYLGTSDFWSRTLQNWQSEFLAVGSMVVFSIYLRQRGSPQSKPVGSPHEATGIEG